jgi:zinc transport system substrate-binding protein
MLHNASNGIGSEKIVANTADEASNVTIDAAKEASATESTKEEATIGNSTEDKLEFEGLNPHVWLDPKLYIKQIENVRDGILKYLEDTGKDLPNISEEIEDNSQTYIQEVMKLDSEINESMKSLSLTAEQITEKQVVIFHDSFAYLANRVGMKVAFTVPLDSDTALSAGDIANIISTVRKDNIKYLFTEQQYSDSIAKQIEAETEAKVYIIDSAVTGDGSKDSYLKAMRNNLYVLKEALN